MLGILPRWCWDKRTFGLDAVSVYVRIWVVKRVLQPGDFATRIRASSSRPRRQSCPPGMEAITCETGEEPQLTTQQYRQASERFMAQARRELADGDLAQASEKGWGAAAQMLEAVAQQRGWEHSRHLHHLVTASRLRSETGDGDIRACSPWPACSTRTSTETPCHLTK